MTYVKRSTCILQFLDIREYHRRVLPTGIATNLLPEEEEEEEPPEGEEDPPGSNDGADPEEQDSEDMSDESELLLLWQALLVGRNRIRYDVYTAVTPPVSSVV